MLVKDGYRFPRQAKKGYTAVQEQTIGFLGAGQMARALAHGFTLAGEITGSQIHVADISPVACEHFCRDMPDATVHKQNAEVVASAEVVFLAVKPQHLGEVFDSIADSVDAEKLFVSIAAGVSLEQLGRGLGSQRVIRVMPNTPCLVGEGVSVISPGQDATARDVKLVHRLLSAVGTALELSESHMDAVTGLSGSGPAFVYQVIEALSDGGVRMGLPRDVATRLAACTVQGAAKMVLQSGEHPAVLKDRVASPGGTTIMGLQALERGGLRSTLMDAVEAAALRSRELGS